jgi:hypothetical protein
MLGSHPSICVVGIDFGTSGTGFAFGFGKIDDKGDFSIIQTCFLRIEWVSRKLLRDYLQRTWRTGS